MAENKVLWQRASALSPRGGGNNIPASVLMSWPAPNYVDPVTHGWAGSIVCIVFLILAFLVYILRMWARIVVAKNAGLDDVLMSCAMVPLCGSTIAVILGVTVYGFQWHAWDQTPRSFITVRQITLAIESLYLVTTTLIKISILCFYRRITSGSISKTFVHWVWASVVFVSAYCIAFVVAIIFSCSPIEGYWHMFDLEWRLSHELKCNNEGAETIAVVVISTAQDLFICALPIVLVWNLHIPLRQKAALIGIFGLGLVTCLCGIMRMYYAIYVYYYTYDVTWYAYYGWIWTALEADLGVICASAPALKVFFRRYFNGSSNRSREYSDQSSRSRKTPRSDRESKGGSRWKDSLALPINLLHVSGDTMVSVGDGEDDASTHELTARSATIPDKAEV